MRRWTFSLSCLSLLFFSVAATADVPVDLSAYKADPAGVIVSPSGSQIFLTWPIDANHDGVVVLETKPGEPLISSMRVQFKNLDVTSPPILKNVEPTYWLTVGTRDLKLPSGWVAFFDDPPKRPHQTYRARRETKAVRVISDGLRATVILEGLSAGPFTGDLRFTLYPGTRLLHTQAVLKTDKDACAILYDTGLTSAGPVWRDLAFLDSHDRWQRIANGAIATAAPLAVRNRTIIAEGEGGSVAVFPPPHQYLYPLDFVDNYGFTWAGRSFHDATWTVGFGIRQPPEGDKRHVPWVNAPPSTEQKLSAFYLLSEGNAETALAEVLKYTHGDRFKRLDGYLTFTSHYHVEHTLDFVAAQQKQNTQGVPTGLEEPEFVKNFKQRGIDIAHLAEFHIDWSHERSPRLDLLKKMHEECARLSNDTFLLLPGEEPNVHLGGHWLSLFPKPVYWTLDRQKGQPFSEQVAGFGTVYHTGNSDDVLKLMETEHGLMWTAHPRIKGSIGFPDLYKSKEFFKSDRFLGAAWKAMPADDSLPRLGSRVLDLLDDTSNWGLQKYALGEVDVFKISGQSELYGHMNVNYLKLNRIPKFSEGWQSVLDTLRAGKFFVTTGEVLIPACTIDGKAGGDTLTARSDGASTLHAELEWTFPLAYAEVISGDGESVYRQRVDVGNTTAFGHRTLDAKVDLKNRSWARFEVWDIATNGAFTQPVWIAK